MLGLGFFRVLYGQKASINFVLHDYIHLVLINTPLFWVVITITFTADIVDTGNNKNAI